MLKILLISNKMDTEEEGRSVELEQLCIEGLNNTYAISNVKKEFRKAVDEPWKDKNPWKRYQQKLIADLAVLEQEMEHAVDLPQFEKLAGIDRLYSIRHPESKKNVRVIYIIEGHVVILLTVFLEKNSGDYQRAIELAQRRLQWLES